MHKYISLILCFVLYSSLSHATARTWETGENLNSQLLNNPLFLNDTQYTNYLDEGIIHSLNYPVDTGVHFPYKPFKTMFTIKHKSPIKKIAQKAIKKITNAESLMDVQKDLGLAPYPETLNEPDLPYYIPDHAIYNHLEQRMGFTIKKRNNVSAFTISCAQCHTSNLFGKSVIGLSNRFPKPNQFFVQVKDMFSKLPLATLKLTADYSKGQYKLLKNAKQKLKFVGAKVPTNLGLDTSLAQVSLSLALRNKDSFASIPKRPKTQTYKKHPMQKLIADSKPMVWWNAKYKNKWLADGSVVSGNPVLTNILWNEIGRGADLKKLESWIVDNKKIIDELTTAVFSSQAPKMIDFVGKDYFSDLDRLKAGQKLYIKTCARCHGIYEKGWDSNSNLPMSELIKTSNVIYSEHTDATEVGTDPERYKSMKYLLPLNKLKISKTNKINIKTKIGYVPPPLVGIWARWPYLHNNSIPSLCELLTPAKNRSLEYMARPSEDINTDFDLNCNGYPIAKQIDDKSPYYFNTSQTGLSNMGHDKGIILDSKGKEILSKNDKTNLIYFLQTL